MQIKRKDADKKEGKETKRNTLFIEHAFAMHAMC